MLLQIQFKQHSSAVGSAIFPKSIFILKVRYTHSLSLLFSLPFSLLLSLSWAFVGIGQESPLLSLSAPSVVGEVYRLHPLLLAPAPLPSESASSAGAMASASARARARDEGGVGAGASALRAGSGVG